MRSFAFNVAYWILSIGYGLTAAFAALAPGRGPASWVIRRYVKRMVQAMSIFAGIKLDVRGKDRLPEGAFIIASKHQSWGDGFATYDQFDDIAFVTVSGATKCMTNTNADGSLSCLVNLSDPPAPPGTVYGQWIGGWVDFDGTTLRVGSAHADPGRFALGTGAPLDDGGSLRFGDYQCRAEVSGLLCVNYAHQSGVRMSGAGTEPFGCLRPVSDPEVGLKFSC